MCIAGSSMGKGVSEELRECVHACGAFVYVVWKCVSKSLKTCTKVRVGDVVYSHKILVVGMEMSLSTHGDSGSMAIQCTLRQSVRGEGGRLVV